MYKQYDHERIAAHLNIQVVFQTLLQVEFLQQANQKLESELILEQTKCSQLQSRVDELSSKNSHIYTELQVSTIVSVRLQIK